MQSRQLHVLFGDSECRDKTIKQTLKELDTADILWVSQTKNADYQSLPHAKTQSILGCEFTLVIYDAHNGFFPDAFGAVAGTIRSGGALLLLLPQVFDTSSRFMQRLVRLVNEDKSVNIIDCQHATKPLSISTHTQKPQTTDDQLVAIEAIKKVVTGHRRRPLVMAADRGRGKSSALGIAAKHLLSNGLQNILLTAPSKKSAEMVFKHAENINGLNFISPDLLVKILPKTDLLFIDEAAAIPAPLLSQLLKHYSRIVFSTTQHGYEGTGRGFDIRFKHELNQQTPNWKPFTLNTPIRWGNNDPLENFVFKALLLNANQSQGEINDVSQLITRKVNRDNLLKNDTLLAQIFGLLVTAHYQTKPSDLQFMLDDESTSIYIIEQDKRLLATALSTTEGGFGDKLAQEIYAGQRRPKGHLIPQSLAFHSGIEQAATLTGERIIRIAVHENCQRQGLATQLIQTILEQSKDKDYIGTSFSATSDMLHFWDAQGFKPVRLGLKRDASSGTHSVIQLLPISSQGQLVFQQLRERFTQSFLHMLSEPLADLESDIVLLLLSNQHTQTIDLEDWMWEELHTFATTNRGYEVCMYSLWNWFTKFIQHNDFNKLNQSEKAILVSKILQKKRWKDIVSEQGFTGKKAALQHLRQSVSRNLSQ